MIIKLKKRRSKWELYLKDFKSGVPLLTLHKMDAMQVSDYKLVDELNKIYGDNVLYVKTEEYYKWLFLKVSMHKMR